eukprot:gene1988-1496_t
MLNFSTLVFVLLFFNVSCYVVQGNIGIVWTTIGDKINIQVVSKSYEGYHCIAFSKNENFSNTYFFTNQIVNLHQKISTFEGNFTEYQSIKESDIFYFLHFDDFNDYPIPKGEQNLWTTLVFNKTRVMQYFNGTKVSIFVGSHQYGKQPSFLDKEPFKFSQKFKSQIDLNRDGSSDWLTNRMFQRLSDASIPSVVVMGIIYFIPMIICIMLTGCGIQPIKSRAWIPVYASLFFFFRDLSSIFHFFSIEQYIYKCYSNYLFNLPFRYSSFVLVILTFLRFVVIANLNKRKSLKAEKRLQSSKVTKLFYKMLKYSTHPLFILITWILTVAFFMVLNVILLTTNACETTSSSNINTYVQFGVFGFMIITLVIIGFIDICLNIKEIFSRCGIWKLFAQQDPFFFRVELYIFGLLVCAPLYVIITFSTLILPIPRFFELVYYMFLDASIWWFQVGFVMTISLKNLIVSCFRKKKRGKLIEKLLTNSEFHEKFLKFSETEWAQENILCHDDIQEFKKNSTIEKANYIISTYFNGTSSELEVNISSLQISPVTKSIADGEIDSNLFENIQRVVVSNMSDTFSRYASTREYKEFIFKNEAFDLFNWTNYTMGKVSQGRLRSGKVRRHTPQVEKKEKEKPRTGRAKKRILCELRKDITTEEKLRQKFVSKKQ